MTANAFDLFVSWACGCERLEDLATCPNDGWESVDDGEPAMSLMMALLDGQEKGWVNHWEQHWFLLLDVKISSTSLEAIVFAVPEQEFQAWIFFNFSDIRRQ